MTKIDGLQSIAIGDPDGIQVALCDYGAAIMSIVVPTPNGDVDVAVGPELADYSANNDYCGATIGRYANRIANGSITVDGARRRLSVNDATGKHCLHGGSDGFHKRRWEVGSVDADRCEFRLMSPHGDQGFPGTLTIDVTYSVLDQSSLRVDFRATSDGNTVISLTNHVYLNLNGQNSNVAFGVADHLVAIAADKYTPTDREGIPLGVMRPVFGSALDLRRPAVLGERLARGDIEITGFGGFDHNYVLGSRDDVSSVVATARAPATQIQLDLLTSQPAMQFYTANSQTPVVARHGSFCFEPQGFPNAPNQPAFPSACLEAGDIYEHFIEYRFSVTQSHDSG